MRVLQLPIRRQDLAGSDVLDRDFHRQVPLLGGWLAGPLRYLHLIRDRQDGDPDSVVLSEFRFNLSRGALFQARMHIEILNAQFPEDIDQDQGQEHNADRHGGERRRLGDTSQGLREPVAPVCVPHFRTEGLGSRRPLRADKGSLTGGSPLPLPSKLPDGDPHPKHPPNR